MLPGVVSLIILFVRWVEMEKVCIDIKRVNDLCIIEMSIGSVTAVYHRVGEKSQLKATGRGNVRQIKALLREFVRNSDANLI